MVVPLFRNPGQGLTAAQQAALYYARKRRIERAGNTPAGGPTDGIMDFGDIDNSDLM